MKYYFQLAEKNPISENWEKIKVHSYEFKTRQGACNFAGYLSNLFTTKVRMTDNNKLLQGSYFHNNNLSQEQLLQDVFDNYNK